MTGLPTATGGSITGQDYCPSQTRPFVNGSLKAWTHGGRDVGFKRLPYTALTDSKLLLVQYVGDAGLSVDGPHGNCKTKENCVQSTYKRSAPSVLKRIATKIQSGRTPDAIYGEEVASGEKIFKQLLLK